MFLGSVPWDYALTTPDSTDSFFFLFQNLILLPISKYLKNAKE